MQQMFVEMNVKYFFETLYFLIYQGQ